MKQKRGGSSQHFRKSKIDAVIITVCAILAYLFFSKYDVLEKITTFTGRYEHLELDEFISLSIFLTIGLVFYSIRRWKDLQNIKILLERKNIQLEKVISNLKKEVDSHQISLNKIRSIHDAAPVGIGIWADSAFRDVNECPSQALSA